MAGWDDVVEDPAFNLGLGLLAGAPTRTPFAAAADQLNRYQALKQNRDLQGMHAQLYRAQAAKMQADAEAAQRQQQQLQAFAASLPPEQQGAFLANPGDFMKSYMAAKVFPKYENELAYTPQGKDQRVLRNPYDTQAAPLGGFKQDVNTPAELQSKVDEQQALLPGKIAQAQAGATRVSVSPIIKYGNSLAEAAGAGIAKDVLSSTQGAEGAVDTIRVAQQLKGAVDAGGVIAGPLANQRLQVAQISAMLGNSTDAAGVARTREAIRGLAQLAIKARKGVSGQGQISDYEQKLFNRGMSGDINDLTAPEIRLIADLAEQEARTSIQRSNTKVNKLFGNELPNVAGALQVEEPTAPSFEDTYSKLPKGATYIGPDGKPRRKR